MKEGFNDQAPSEDYQKPTPFREMVELLGQMTLGKGKWEEDSENKPKHE